MFLLDTEMKHWSNRDRARATLKECFLDVRNKKNEKWFKHKFYERHFS